MPSNEESVLTKLQRIAKKASTDKDFEFTSLYHLMNKELLLKCFMQLKGTAASGINYVTKEKCISDQTFEEIEPQTIPNKPELSDTQNRAAR